MHNVILKAVKRFHTRKLFIFGQSELKFSSSPVVKDITSITMAAEEKDIEFETTQSEFYTLTWLYKSAPCFAINGSKIKIIHEPSVFYSTLVQKCKNARKRITFASLYLGTGKLESNLVNAVNEALITSNGNVEVKILIDFMRGSRGKLNSRKMLKPLLNGKYGHCCQIFLYHTPKLRGFLKMITPDRFNELIGLQHMKLYMIDNDIIISGANLSNDYFTNRQDRYFVIEDCEELCDFYNELVQKVGEFSFVLKSDGNTVLNPAVKVNPLKDPITFIEKAAHSVKALFQRELESDPEKIAKNLDVDTWIFPSVQMGQLNVYHDSQITLKLLQTAPPGTTLKLATGYFNLTSEYSEALLKHCQGTCHLLTAHPTANGFFTAKGIAGCIPAAYTKIEETFVKYCNKLGQQNRVILWEFIRPGWTYHAKGLWYFLPEQEKPCLTLIGSPNFGYRSVNKDLETQITIVTKNKNLQNELQREHERLFSCAKRVTNKTFFERDRIPPSWKNMNKLLTTSIREVSQKINAGDVGPSDVTKAAIKVASAIKPLNAYITVTDKIAKEHAVNSDSRQRDRSLLGKLDGIPIAIKDNYCTKGHLTTCASKMLSNFIPTYNATVYQRLKDAGAVLIGKTNLDEFAMGSGTIDSYYGPTKNLWNSDLLPKFYSCNNQMKEHTEQNKNADSWHIAGGSSGGSAVAVITGSCYAAIGSDTGGSTRNPASYCGLIGLKPTYGLVSRYGLIPLVNSMDVPGILTRNVDDAVLVLNIIAGPDEFDSTCLQKEYVPFDIPDKININNIRIGIPKEYKEKNLSREVQECWDEISRYLSEDGALLSTVSLPHTNYSIMCYTILNRCDIASNLACYDGMEYGYRSDEWSSVYNMYKKTRSEGFGKIVKERILVGNYFLLKENYEEYYVKAMKIRRLISEDFDAVWNNNIDLLLTPTTLTAAPTYNDFISIDNQAQCLIQDYCTQPANMAGIPALNVPIKLSKNGLPLSLQLMGPPLKEKELLTVAKWIEQRVQFPKPELKDLSLLQ